MAYVNKQNLSDFWTNAKRYIVARDADQCDWTSIPVNAPFYQFEAEPRTPVNPVIEFGFTETPPAEGEKGPDNPSTITGVDSITVKKCGKNLLSYPYKGQSGTTNGVSFTVNDDGTVLVNGTASSVANFMLDNFVNLKKGVSYCFSGCPAAGSSYGINIDLRTKRSNSQYINTLVETGSGNTFIPSSDCYGAIYINIRSGATVSNLVFKPQLELGSTATAYEPPSPVSATVSLGETRYGGTLDVATGKMTVTHALVNPSRQMIADFQASNPASGVWQFYCNDLRSSNVKPKDESADNVLSDFVCNYFLHNRSGTTVSYHVSANYSYISMSGSSEADARQSLLDLYDAAVASNNPIAFIYPLATPFTVDLTPQQLFSALSNSKVNTVFTDTGTIAQLTYAKPAPRQEDVFRYANWHRTETAGAVTCCPVPESELHPVVNFSFTETPPAEGEKGSDNPSTITGVSSVKVTRCEKNLLSYPYYPQYVATGSENGITWVDNGQGEITFNGTASETLYFSIKPSTGVYRQPLKAGVTYTLSGCPTGGNNDTYVLIANTYNSSVIRETGTGATFTPSVDDTAWVVIAIRSGTTVSNLVFRPQLEFNSTNTSFKPYSGTDYAINLNNTYYGGSIDLATGLMTVTWKGYVFDGTESWNSNSTHGLYYRYALSITMNKNTNDMACTHFNRVNNLEYDIQHYIVVGGGISIFTTQTTVEDFKGWLASEYEAGHPVTVAYALNQPFTVQLTPQQIKALPALDKYSYRVNTLYTDADSIQVGYMKSPIKTEEEFNNAILALGGNL